MKILASLACLITWTLSVCSLRAEIDAIISHIGAGLPNEQPVFGKVPGSTLSPYNYRVGAFLWSDNLNGGGGNGGAPITYFPASNDW